MTLPEISCVILISVVLHHVKLGEGCLHGVRSACARDTVWTFWYFWFCIIAVGSFCCGVCGLCFRKRQQCLRRRREASNRESAQVSTVSSGVLNINVTVRGSEGQVLPPAYEQIVSMEKPPEYKDLTPVDMVPPPPPYKEETATSQSNNPVPNEPEVLPQTPLSNVVSIDVSSCATGYEVEAVSVSGCRQLSSTVSGEATNCA